MLAAALRDAKNHDSVRDAALDAVRTIGGDRATKALVEVLGDDTLSEDRQKVVIAALGKFKADAAVSALVQSLGNTAPAVRDAAVGALASVLGSQKEGPAIAGVKAIRARLLDRFARRSASGPISALGAIKDRASIPDLIAAAEKEETRFEAAEALAAMPDIRAFSIYLRALGDKSPDLRRQAATAVAKLRDQAIPILEQLAKRNELPTSALPELRTVFNGLEPIQSWKLLGPFPIKDESPFPIDGPVDLKAEFKGGRRQGPWGGGPPRPSIRRGQINLGRIYSQDDDRSAFGYAEIDSPADRSAMMAVGSDDTLTVWVERPAGLRLPGPPGLHGRGGEVRGQPEEGQEHDPDPLRQPRRPLGRSPRRSPARRNTRS